MKLKSNIHLIYGGFYLLAALAVFLVLPLGAPGAETGYEPIVVAEAEGVDELVHVVRPGDSVWAIANRYKVHRWQIRQWNGLDYTNAISPGQELVIKRVDYEPREGLASWYGPGFHGRNMANGQVYDMYDILVAHRTLPLGRKVKITNLDNGRSIIAPVLDRGPYVKNASGEYTREIDLSYGVAMALGTVPKGVVPALIEPINEGLPAGK